MPREFDTTINNLPTAYRKDPWVLDLLGAAEGLDEDQRAAAWDVAAQMFLASMTWQLGTEEQLAGLRPTASDTVEERRAALSAKWQAAADKCDLEKIKAVCGSWQGVAAEVTYNGLNLITVLFRSWADMPSNMDSVRAALREIIPAHLRFAVTAQLVRETTAGIYTVVTASRRKCYPDIEVDQWHREAEAVQYSTVTTTRHRNYTEIEVQ